MKLFFFFSHKNMSVMKLKKVAYCSSVLFLSPIYARSVIEAILPNTFFQNSLASSRKLLMKLFSKKKQLY